MRPQIPRKKAPRRFCAVLACVAVVPAVLPARVDAQDLPLRREPQEVAFRCPAPQAPERPTDAAASEAAQLGSDAAQAAILGDQARARDLLARASRLDPLSGDIAYRYARILEDAGELEAALGEYCRQLSLEPSGQDADDAAARIQDLASGTQIIRPDAANLAFRNGLALADLGRLDEALADFQGAAEAAPDWPDPYYNRGVLFSRLGLPDEAATSLRRYLELRPDGEDAVRVAEQIGRLEGTARRSTASPALALGLSVVPGMGQVYTGSPGVGAGFTVLAGSAALEAFFYERGRGRGYFGTGLATAGAVTAIGAIDALMQAHRQSVGGAFRPNPGLALALGAIPGMGQFYSGRRSAGLGFLTLVSGLTAAADIGEEGDDRRFVTPGLAVAGGTLAISAIEAYMNARRSMSDTPPDPWKALALGVVPGLGQFYEGRTGLGFTVLAIASSATAASFDYEEGEGRGFFAAGFTIAGAATGIAAIEAFFNARRMAGRGFGESDQALAWNVGRATLHGPALVSAGREVSMRLVGLTF